MVRENDILYEVRNPDFKNWYAMYNHHVDAGVWHFVPKNFWDANGYIPDMNIEPEVGLFQTCMEWCWEGDGGENEINEILNLGFTIIEFPN